MTTLGELARLAEGRDDLFIRWSRGPEADASGVCTDDMTGVELPGLAASPLTVDPWWEGRSIRLWVARRLYEYSHLKHEKGPGVRPWILEGTELARGLDNEPLVQCDRAVAWVSEAVLNEAERMIESTSEQLGPLNGSDG